MTFINAARQRRVTGSLPAPTAERIVSAATGGTETTITLNGRSYRVHTFTATGSFVATAICEVDYLIVAGGGSGGGHGGGGGGAGGVIVGSKLIVPVGSHSVVVGAGAARNAEGGNSSFQGITAIGGGRGCWYNVANAQPGGSGGGATFILSVSNGVAGAGTLGQGFRGGDVIWANTGNHAASGGGGAGGMGYEPSDVSQPSGWGGPGRFCNIDGNSFFYGGGGGGGTHYSRGGDGGIGGGGGGSCASGGGYYTPVGTAGNGGGSARNTGGNGGPNALGGAGGANTGGGGGGGHPNGDTGGTGGSGIVIIRYRLY